MQLRKIVVGADHSEEGAAAILAGARLARRSGAKLTALTVAAAAEAGIRTQSLAGLRDLVRSALRPMPDAPQVELAFATGLPGVEIGRYAETDGADLVVVGRKRRSGLQRLLIGDTADSVARRSGVPCLFVVAGAPECERVLVALDGTERGMTVLIAAMDFTRDTGNRLHAVSVEPAFDNERDAPRVLTSRSARLLEAVDEIRLNTNLGRGAWEAPYPPQSGSPIVFHRGRVVDEIIEEVRRSATDVLVVGYHRGGPAGIVDAGSVARRLAHQCPCSVLTIPL